MAITPDFITHYHLPDRAPFLNLSDLDDEELEPVLSGLEVAAVEGTSHRRFGPRYMALRRASEEVLRARFIACGGRAVRKSPHYFVLGESPWFRGLYEDAAAVRYQLDELPSECVSFTCPDSITSMGLLPDFGIHLTSQPHHGRVFRLEELDEFIRMYGLPGGSKPDTYEGHQSKDFEHYLEVQVWSESLPLHRAPTGSW